MRDKADICRRAAAEIRRDIIDMTFIAGSHGAHLGGSLSIVDLLVGLYLGHMKAWPQGIEFGSVEERDRIIMSKGHAALALYPVLSKAGIIPEEELITFKHNGSRLGAHPSLNGLPGIEFASGSLGQGLSLGVGTCLALREKNNAVSRVFVFLGDGECNEGMVWEAAMCGAHYGLKQLNVIVDKNHLQYDGNTEDVMNMDPLAEKWEKFGWDTCVIDGHDMDQIIAAYGTETDKPRAIIADTIKGKGVSFMENKASFHNARLSEQMYHDAIREIDQEINRWK